MQAGLAWRKGAGLEKAPMLVVGDPVLCGYYAQALTQWGVSHFSVLDNTAAHGLGALRQAASAVPFAADLRLYPL